MSVKMNDNQFIGTVVVILQVGPQSWKKTNPLCDPFRAMTLTELLSYHILKGFQNNESNTKVVKTFMTGPQHGEARRTEWWNELGVQTAAVLLNSQRFYDLSYRRQTNTHNPKSVWVETNLKTFSHSVELSVEGIWCMFIHYVLVGRAWALEQRLVYVS